MSDTWSDLTSINNYLKSVGIKQIKYTARIDNLKFKSPEYPYTETEFENIREIFEYFLKLDEFNSSLVLINNQPLLLQLRQEEVVIYDEFLYTLLGSIQGFSLDFDYSTKDEEPLNLPLEIFLPFTNLKSLYITSHRNVNLEDGLFDNLANLETLVLAECYIKDIPHSIFSKLTKLRSLDLSSNQISSLPLKFFSDLSNIEDLKLNCNELTEIEVMDVLQMLNVYSRNKWESWSTDPIQRIENIFRCQSNDYVFESKEHKEYFHGEHRKFEFTSNDYHISNQINDFLQNTVLEVKCESYYNYSNIIETVSIEKKDKGKYDRKEIFTLIEGIIDFIHSFSLLRNIQIYFVPIESLPERLFEFKNKLLIEKLGIIGTNISELSEDIFQGFDNLKELKLSHNSELSVLPLPIFKGLVNLRRLDLSSNKLPELPIEIFDGLSKIEYLSADFGVHDLPMSIGALTLMKEYRRYGGAYSVSRDEIFDGEYVVTQGAIKAWNEYLHEKQTHENFTSDFNKYNHDWRLQFKIIAEYINNFRPFYFEIPKSEISQIFLKYRELLKIKFLDILKRTEMIHIDDLANLLKVEVKNLKEKLFDLHDNFEFKLRGDYIIFDSSLKSFIDEFIDIFIEERSSE